MRYYSLNHFPTMYVAAEQKFFFQGKISVIKTECFIKIQCVKILINHAYG